MCSGRRKVSLVVSSPIVFKTGHIIAELVMEEEADRKFQEGIAQNLQTLHIPPGFELQEIQENKKNSLSNSQQPVSSSNKCEGMHKLTRGRTRP